MSKRNPYAALRAAILQWMKPRKKVEPQATVDFARVGRSLLRAYGTPRERFEIEEAITREMGRAMQEQVDALFTNALLTPPINTGQMRPGLTYDDLLGHGAKCDPLPT